MPYYAPALTRHIAFRAPYSQLAATTPSAFQEFGNTTSGRARADLTGATQARLIVRTNSAPSANTKIRVQYALVSDGSGTFNYLDGDAGPSITIGSQIATAASSWVNITPAAMTDVILRLVTLDGDGSTSANWANMYLEVR